ncbi:MAG: DUF6531 domain-containing protein [Vulcanimicrobiaceae bacterium]
MNVNNSVGSTTGVLAWWAYYSGAIAGAGSYNVNVANGNFVFLASDVNVPHKGVPLEMVRSYNSQSTHDNVGTDGSVASNYGNGWTCSYDVRVANNASGGISVFAADGSRFDYTPDGSGGYIPPPGVHAELQLFATAVQWTQTDGTVYVFNLPTQLPATAGLTGRLASIYGRNTNNNLVLTYSFDGGDASSAENLNQIVVTAEDGMALTLAFANFNGIRLLSSLTWPNGSQVTYSYDSYANLISVSRPGNNISATLEESHSYLTPVTSHQMQTIVDPRQNLNSSDGSWMTMAYNSSGETSSLNSSGYVNPTIADGTSAGPIQPSEPTGLTVFSTVTINYPSNGNSNVGDTDGHYVQYVFDSLGRVTTKQSYTSPTTYLTTQAVWDTDNQFISKIDPRGYETDYANDGYGDVTAIGSPSTVTTEGTFRPTTYSSYDSNHNLLASCDPHWSNQNGMDWTSRPSNSMTLCPSTSGTTRNVYSPTSAEPFGELTSTTTPLGYVTTIAYSPSSQGGTDYGLPTSRTDASITQNDSTIWTPQQAFSYDVYGNVVSQNDGVGTWTTTYDGINRPLSTTDPDSVTSYTAYYANGQTQMTSTAVQHGAGTGTILTYDADGNETSVTHHFGDSAGVTTPGVTSYYFDGPGRLVETIYPHDPTDFFSYSTMRRNLYDLTQGGTVSLGSNTGLKAYGQLFAVQEYSPTGTQAGSPSGTPTWNTTDGKTFDALDRPIATYELAYLSGAPQYIAVYDGSSATLGLLSSQTDAFGQVSTFSYDARGMRNAANYSNLQTAGSTPTESYEADADGRLASATYSTTGTSTSTYDADGRLVTSSGTGASPYGTNTITYGYYANGARSTLSIHDTTVGVAGVTYSNMLVYDYAANGKLKTLVPSSTLGLPGSFSWTYSNAGRTLSESDPYTGSAVSASSPWWGSYTLVPASRTYSHGQIATLTLPMTGSYTYMNYDLEDELTSARGWYTPNQWPETGPYSVSYAYNIRGENTTTSYSESPFSTFSTAFPYQGLAAGSGAMSFVNVSGGANAPVASFNPLSGQITKITNATSGYRTFSYDALGRSVSGSTQPVSPAETLTRSFDARNRLISDYRDNYPFPGGTDCAGNLSTAAGNPHTESYVYGPFGRPEEIVGSELTGRNELVRWDGPNVLYTVNTQGHGSLDDLKISDLDGNVLAEVAISPTAAQIVWDRDMNGNVVSSHNATGFGGWTTPNSYSQQCAAGITASSSTYEGKYITSNAFGPLASFGSDGIAENSVSHGFNAFEGARAWDQITGQWMTPDLSSSYSSTPQVQSPATWHRNNALSNVDPSGTSSTRNVLGLSVSHFHNDIAYQSLRGASSGSTSSIPTDPRHLPDAAPGSLAGGFSLDVSARRNPSVIILPIPIKCNVNCIVQWLYNEQLLCNQDDECYQEVLQTDADIICELIGGLCSLGVLGGEGASTLYNTLISIFNPPTFSGGTYPGVANSCSGVTSTNRANGRRSTMAQAAKCIKN